MRDPEAPVGVEIMSILPRGKLVNLRFRPVTALALDVAVESVHFVEDQIGGRRGSQLGAGTRPGEFDKALATADLLVKDCVARVPALLRRQEINERWRVRHHHDSRSGAANDQEFGRLEQDPRISTFEQESAENSGEDHRNADQC